jgi:hypothetical protein
MKLLKISGMICMQNIRKWATNYRIWIVAILLLILTHSYTESFRTMCETVNMDMSPWIFPFLYNNWYVRLLFIAPLLLIFCDAPFTDSNQPYVIVRSGRKYWSIGQMAYIIVTSAVYFLFLFVISILLNIQYIDFSADWGKVLETMANRDGTSTSGINSTVSSRILFYFTPQSAIWFTFLLSWLCGIFIGMIVYVVNSMTSRRNFGVLTATFFVVLSSAGFEKKNWFSPVSWTDLDTIDIGGLSQNPPITYVFSVYGILILILFIMAFIINRKQVIQVMQQI